jgi:hypothetical protein
VRYDPAVLAYESGRAAELLESVRAALPILIAAVTLSMVLLAASAAAGRRDVAIVSLFLPFGVGVGTAIVFLAL